MSPPLRPYPETRDSGAAWLGRVPTHWAVLPLGRIGRFFKGFGGTKADEVADGVPCVRYGDLYTSHKFAVRETRSLVALDRAADYMPIRYGDLLFAGSGETIDEIGKSAVNLIASRACCGGDVLVLRPTRALHAPFLGYASDHRLVADEKARMGQGVTVMHIYTNSLKWLMLPVPPLAEQRSIARFLDHSCRRIGRYLAAKERLIELLEEQKQAVIRRAVTRGLDPAVPHKPSGIEWLGDIPAHWMVAALHLRYSQVLGKMLDSKRITGRNQVPYLRNVDVQWDRINVADLPTMDVAESEYARYAVEPGDLLVCEGGEVGRCAIWTGELGRCIFQKALHRLRPRRVADDLPRFLYYALRAAKSGGAFESGFVSTIAHLTGERLRAHRFPFPPGAEQQAIVAHLDRATAALDAAIARTRRQRELVAEYRTRLVADVATGKLDVREAARRLPADPDDGDDARA